MGDSLEGKDIYGGFYGDRRVTASVYFGPGSVHPSSLGCDLVTSRKAPRILVEAPGPQGQIPKCGSTLTAFDYRATALLHKIEIA